MSSTPRTNKTFLVPLDIDPASTDALEFALDMSSPEDKLILLHLDRVSAFLHPDGRIRKEEPTHEQQELIERLKQKSGILCGTAGRSCTWRQYKFQGDVSEEICRHAQEDHVNQVVMGSRGLGTIGGIMLGSVSQGVLKHCHCPITFVKHSNHE